jgi:choline-sulfatase
MPAGIMDPPKAPIAPNVQRMQKSKDMTGMTVEQKQIMTVNYFAKITLIDHYIGQMLDALEETGLADNTWVIYNSDHGEMLGDHMMYNKIVFYDASVRVPLIVRPPGGTQGWQSEALTDVIGVTASIIDIANAAPVQTDGQSLVSQIQAGPDAEGAQKGKDAVISEVMGQTMIFDGQYKLGIESVSEKPEELYDVETDPNELNNRVEDPELQSVIQDLIETHIGPLRDRFDHDLYEHWLKMRAQNQKARRKE